MALDIGRRRLGREIGTARDARPADARCGDRGSRALRAGLRHPTGPVGHPGLHHRRAIRRGGRHLAGQYLSGERVRRPLPPLLTLLLPEVRLDPPLRRAAGDPLLRRTVRRPASSSDRISGWGPPCSGPSSTRTQQRWRLVLASAGGEEQIEADTVIFACGQLNRPHVPDLPGLGDFAGPMWHSARWDHGCDLAGQRVAVVGSGASAIQFVPPVAERAAALTIYQRTPNYVGPKKDRPYRAPDPMAVRPRPRRRAGLPVVDLLGPRVPVDLVPQGQLGRRQAERTLRQGDPRTRWCPTACPRSRWSPTTQSAASAF